MIESLKKQYQIDAADLPTISNLFVYDNESKEWIFKDTSKKQAQFIKIEDLIFTYDDFLVFLNKKSPKKLNGIQKSNFIAEQYGIFLEDQLLEYKKEQLPFENLEYAQILKEYEEGLLLFDIMQEKIWDGAKNDSTGLLAHYQEHINKFSSPAQLTASIARSSKKATLKKTKKLWENGSSNEAITSALNAKEQKVILSSGSFNIDDPLLPKQTQFTTGISSIYSLEDGYVLLNITGLAPEKNLSFEASKGAVISSYQETLEKQWIQNLRKKYNFSVNNEMLEALSSKVSQ
jgi:peptidyl-prolyl cis-trans isomerase SurA